MQPLQQKHKIRDPKRALNSAIEKGDLKAAKAILDVYEPEECDMTSDCAFIAARQGHLDVIQWLFSEFDFEPRDMDHHDHTVLHIAVKAGHLDIVQWLLDTFGADGVGVNLVAFSGDNVISLAAYYGGLRILTYLLTNYGSMIDLHLKNNYKDLSILHSAIVANKLDMVEWIMDTLGTEGCGFDSQAQYKRNVVMFAAMWGRFDIVKLLLRKYGSQFDLLKKDETGLTTLHLTLLFYQFPILEWLLETFGPAKCGLAVTDDQGRTVVALAQIRKLDNIVQKLLEKFGPTKCGYKLKSFTEGAILERSRMSSFKKGASILL